MENNIWLARVGLTQWVYLIEGKKRFAKTGSSTQNSAAIFFSATIVR